MLTEEQALVKLKRLRTSTTSMRAWYDSFLTLAMIYDHGEQWGFMRPNLGAIGVSYLKNITDPAREDIRVTINKIHENVVRLDAALAPEQIAFSLVPGGASDRVMKRVGEEAMRRYLDRIDAIQVFRDKTMHRLVLGGCFVRRTLATVGKAVPMGKGKGGKDISIRNFRPGVALVSPHEILRDPASNTCHPGRDEIIFAHEKPRSVEWVKRNFGIEIKTTATLGSLYEYQRQIRDASGMGPARHVTESKEPGVIVYECFYQDADIDRPWPWVLYGYMDTADQNAQIQPLVFARNPFWGLPFHLYKYDTQIQSPWPRGVPHVQMRAQDLFNIGVSWYARMMQEGGGRWRYASGTLKPHTIGAILSNDLRTPIEYDPIFGALTPGPERTAAPQINANTLKLMEKCPEWIRDSINMVDVQRGVSSKRGEPGKALEIKLGEANAPLEKIRRDDDLVTAQLLQGLFYDLTDRKHLRLDEARELLGDSMPDEFIRTLVREDSKKAIVACKVHSSMHRPKTPGEVRQNYITLVTSQVKDKYDAEWEMMLRGEYTNTAMQNAFDKQLTEIKMIEHGEQVEALQDENHGYHLRSLEWFTDQPAFLTLDKEIQLAIEDHGRDHREWEMMLAMGQQMMEAGQPGQGSPPKADAGLGGSPTGAMEPATATL